MGGQCQGSRDTHGCKLASTIRLDTPVCAGWSMLAFHAHPWVLGGQYQGSMPTHGCWVVNTGVPCPPMGAG